MLIGLTASPAPNRGLGGERAVLTFSAVTFSYRASLYIGVALFMYQQFFKALGGNPNGCACFGLSSICGGPTAVQRLIVGSRPRSKRKCDCRQLSARMENVIREEIGKNRASDCVETAVVFSCSLIVVGGDLPRWVAGVVQRQGYLDHRQQNWVFP